MELFMATYAPNQLHAVPLAELQPDPTQPRKYLDPLAEDRDMIMETLTSLKNTLEEVFAAVTNPSNNLA